MGHRNNSRSLSKSKLYTAVVFDLGDVLFTWSPSTPKSPLPSNTLKNILRSFHWFEYEKGNLTEKEVYSLVAQEFGVAAVDVKGAFEAARDSLKSNPKLLDVIQELRESGLAIYAMSNISAPDWAVLSTKATPQEWALFDHVFTSADARERKPNIGFYEHVIEQTRIDPSCTIFVDDKIENVLSARSFGMHGIVFDDQAKVVQQIKNLCGDPILRGNRFLVSRKKHLTSVTSNNIELSENFAQLLILETTGDKSLVEYVKYPEEFNFFQNGGVLTSKVFPNDLDTTSLGLTIADHIDATAKHKVMDKMLKYQNSDGIIQVYFDHARPRIDPVVCVNVLNLFYKYGRGHELPKTLDWVEQVLTNRAYIAGTYYYATADQFLFFLSRLMNNSSEVRQRLGPVLKERIVERFGAEADSLSLASRIIAACTVGIVDHRDLETLLSMQSEDGSWGNGWFYKFGASGILIRNDGVTTALAIRAIQEADQLCRSQLNPMSKLPFLTSVWDILAKLYIGLLWW